MGEEPIRLSEPTEQHIRDMLISAITRWNGDHTSEAEYIRYESRQHNQLDLKIKGSTFSVHIYKGNSIWDREGQ
jgi:hypothetical protein